MDTAAVALHADGNCKPLDTATCGVDFDVHGVELKKK